MQGDMGQAAISGKKHPKAALLLQLYASTHKENYGDHHAQALCSYHSIRTPEASSNIHKYMQRKDCYIRGQKHGLV